MTQDDLAILEAVLFACPEPLSIEQLQAVMGEVEKESIIQNLNILREDYEKRGSGLTIVRAAGGYRMSTRADLHPWLSRLATAGLGNTSRSMTLQEMHQSAYRSSRTGLPSAALLPGFLLIRRRGCRG